MGVVARWITVRKVGVCNCGKLIRVGEKGLWYEVERVLRCEECGAGDWKAIKEQRARCLAELEPPADKVSSSR